MDKPKITYAFELDGLIHCLDGQDVVLAESLESLRGDKRLVTDFGEALSRFMSVEGPVKFAEVLVKRKLQESGEFEEPVEILTHWKKKRGKHGTDIFFTAVPTRLARVYFDDLRAGADHTLVFAMYGVLWHVLQRMSGNHYTAVVFRHERFAEVIVGTRNKVVFANRCVAFDAQEEQIRALWENVRVDIESVQNDHHIEVNKIVCLGWVNACERPPWPEEWQSRVVLMDAPPLMVDGMPQPVSWPDAAKRQPAYQSASPPTDIALYYAQRWAPAANMALLAIILVLLMGTFGYRLGVRHIENQLLDVRNRIGRISLETVALPVSGEAFGEQLKFIQDLDHSRRQPSYRQIVNDLTQPDFYMMHVRSLKLDYGADAVRVELFGDIVAPFDQAHGGYKNFLHHLKRKGYRIDESRFETQISKSQVVLKLTRPLA